MQLSDWYEPQIAKTEGHMFLLTLDIFKNT